MTPATYLRRQGYSYSPGPQDEWNAARELIAAHKGKLSEVIARHPNQGSRWVARKMLTTVKRYERTLAATRLSDGHVLGMLGPNGMQPAVDHEYASMLRATARMRAEVRV